MNRKTVFYLASIVITAVVVIWLIATYAPKSVETVKTTTDTVVVTSVVKDSANIAKWYEGVQIRHWGESPDPRQHPNLSKRESTFREVIPDRRQIHYIH